MQKKARKVNVVIFDFDGTLSAHDANYEFGKYCFKHSLRAWLFLPITLFGMSFRHIAPNAAWWRQIGRRFINAKMVKRFGGGTRSGQYRYFDFCIAELLVKTIGAGYGV